jgi:DivIVA domain-containing protein
MELSPKTITSVEFQLVRKGYDPDEVRSFLTSLAKGVEAMQTQLANADARARAAVQRMQEISSQPVAQPQPVVEPTPAPVATVTDAGQSETIARTLLLAQRTADATVADAEERSRSIVATAEDRSRQIVDEAEQRAAQVVRAAEDRSVQMIERAKADAVQAHAGETARIEAEVNSLATRREDLHQTIEVLGAHVIDQRSRLSNAAEVLRSLLEDKGVLAVVEPPSAANVDPILEASAAVPPPPTVPSWMSGYGAESSDDRPEPLGAGEAPVQANEPLVVDVREVDRQAVDLNPIEVNAVEVSPAADHLPGLGDVDEVVDVPTFNDVRWASDDD